MRVPSSLLSARVLPAPLRRRVGGWIYGTSLGWLAWFVREGLRDSGWLRSWRLRKPVTRDGQPLPWYTYSAIHFLEDRIRPDMRVFEYGCGNSTLWWAARVADVVSVEHDPSWAEAMAKQAPANATIVLQTDPTMYAVEIKRHGPFDVVVVDGVEPRYDSARAAVTELAPDGVIIWDNSNSEEFVEARRTIHELGEFRELVFHGFGPTCVRFWSTSILYRHDSNNLGI